MNPHHFGWQVYLILDEGNRKLDVLLQQTIGNIRSHGLDKMITLDEFRRFLLDPMVQEELGRFALSELSQTAGLIPCGFAPLINEFRYEY